MNSTNQASLAILVFGATGGTGSQFVEQALATGHRITAIVRNPAAITHQHSNLHVLKGDVTEFDTFAARVRGHDAVVSCLGIKHLKPTSLYSDGVRNILKAMQAADVNRLMCISSSAIDVSPKLPWYLRLLTKYILQRVFRHLYADTRLMEQLLKQSLVNWTSVRPPRLTDKPLTGTYRYAIDEFLDRCTQISRSDLAHFMVDHLEDIKTFRTVVEVAN